MGSVPGEPSLKGVEREKAKRKKVGLTVQYQSRRWKQENTNARRFPGRWNQEKGAQARRDLLSCGKQLCLKGDRPESHEKRQADISREGRKQDGGGRGGKFWKTLNLSVSKTGDRALEMGQKGGRNPRVGYCASSERRGDMKGGKERGDLKKTDPWRRKDRVEKN